MGTKSIRLGLGLALVVAALVLPGLSTRVDARVPPGECELCLTVDNGYQCCDDPDDPWSDPVPEGCSEYDVQGEFWRHLGEDCSYGRCANDCLQANRCQEYDSAIDGTFSRPCPEIQGGWAWKNGISSFGDSDYWNHTYFCLSTDWSDCYSIIGAGQTSRKEGGEQVPNTMHSKSRHEECLARERASNDWGSACGFFSQLYGINGVCHQQTNRGHMSMHGDFMNPSYIEGGWLTFTLYGAYGISYWPVCFPGSKISCAWVH